MKFQIKKKNHFKKTPFRTALRQKYAVFYRNLRINHENLQICDLLTGTPRKFADSRQRTDPKNIRLGSCGLLKKLACLVIWLI
jgi:hypothetical protein